MSRVSLPSATVPFRNAGHRNLAAFRAAYARAEKPEDVMRDVYAQIEARGRAPVWISLVPLETTLAALAHAFARQEAGEHLPLLGIPFAVKDNIDVAGIPTTAGCPAFSYVPQRHAFVVQKLVDAGAIPIGKTNLDQFATGLNGTRSPYGIPTSVYDERYVSGGSSSGSAVAVAADLVPFALGTDTAGSGRVPAAFNNLVGLKPTKGWFSSSGLVPAVRSQDCITVFAHRVSDAKEISQIAAGYDESDPFSRIAPAPMAGRTSAPVGLTFGVPQADQLEFFGDQEAEALFHQAVGKLEKMGLKRVEFDYSLFEVAAQMLYDGPWVAERLAAVEAFADQHADVIHPVVRDIIFSAKGMTAVDVFKGQYRLAELVRAVQPVWECIDVMLLPTAPTIYTVEQMLADPVRLNSRLGYYTNFVNLMDASALAVPAGFRTDGLPFGVTLVGRAFEDDLIAELGAWLTGEAEPNHVLGVAQEPSQDMICTRVSIAVVGAHLRGQPLNPQLIECGAVFRRQTCTASGYALYVLPDSVPEKPGLVREPGAQGNIEVEIWDLPIAGFGAFVSAIPSPLGIGSIQLEDSSYVQGFLCEPYALQDAADITHLGGWKAYRASLSQRP